MLENLGSSSFSKIYEESSSTHKPLEGVLELSAPPQGAGLQSWLVGSPRSAPPRPPGGPARGAGPWWWGRAREAPRRSVPCSGAGAMGAPVPARRRLLLLLLLAAPLPAAAGKDPRPTPHTQTHTHAGRAGGGRGRAGG